MQEALEAGLVILEIGPTDERLATMLPALQEAFGLVQEYLTQAKRRARVLDFTDLEVHALRALRAPQVQSYYAQRWKAFLVDEFQDTNPVQGELLEFLTQGTILSIVGDAKQSIYGFRRADVAVFGAWRERIIAAGGTEVVLDTSFRTHQTLVQAVNRVFALVLGELRQDLDAHRTESPHPGPHLRVYAVAEKGVNKPQLLPAEGMYIAQQLKEMLDAQTLVHDKGSGRLRPLVPGDIAILSRTWGPLDLYGEALASLGIPVAPAGGGNLLETREAKDAWALLRFLADPTDDLALVAVLRSPWFAVSDRVLFIVAQTLPQETSWWQYLQEMDVSELTRPVAVLSQLLREQAVAPPTRLLQMADRLSGYTAVIGNLPGAARREADWRGFLELVRRLEQGTNDVFGVVRRLKRLAVGGVEVPRLPLQAENAVALMTIHGAKGLEWPVVVVPDLTYQRRNNTEPVYFDPELGVALKLEDEAGESQKPFLYIWLEQRHKQQEEAEALRVLYVALTRARDHLILTAADDRGGGIELLQPGLEAAGIPLELIPFAPESARPPVPPEPALLPEPPGLLIGPVGSGLFELPVTALSEYAQCPKRFQFRFIEGHPGMGSGVAARTRVGTLVHLALEHGIRDVDSLAAFDISLGQEFVEEAVALAQRFDEVPEFTCFWGAIVSREKVVTLKVGQLTLKGVVDLVGDDWVLDFKTDREMSPQHHRFQLWAYAHALERQKAHIAYLRHDRLHSFGAAELAAAGQEAQSLVRGIVNGDYDAMPSSANCGWCPYGEICDLRYRELPNGEFPTVSASEQDTSRGDEVFSANPQELSPQEPSKAEPLQKNDLRVEYLCEQIGSRLSQAATMYHRLIVVVEPLDGSKAPNLRQVALRTNCHYINVNLELSRRLMELTQRQRSRQVSQILNEIVGRDSELPVLLDHLEILFDISLKLNPLGYLKDLARYRTVIAAWRGKLKNGHLTYAEFSHPEYRCEPIRDFLAIS